MRFKKLLSIILVLCLTLTPALAGAEISEEQSMAKKEDLNLEDAEPSNLELDFSSKRLLIIPNENTILPDDNISELNGVYLAEFESEEEARKAYTYYLDAADFVDVDVPFEISELDESIQDDETTSDIEQNSTFTDVEEQPVEDVIENNTENNNSLNEKTEQNTDLLDEEKPQDPFTEVSNLLEEEQNKEEKDYIVAVIDTGCNDEDIEKISVLGDEGLDINGHGTRVIDTIKQNNLNANILSIKALDDNGKGDTSSIYAAIEYAIQRNVNLINISASAFYTEENSILKEIVDRANKNGIIIVASAGNNNKDAKYYIPANLENVITVGSIKEDGTKQEFSNYGSCVNIFAPSNSTSEASAIVTGLISLNKCNINNVNDYIKNLEFIKEVNEEVNKGANENIESAQEKDAKFSTNHTYDDWNELVSAIMAGGGKRGLRQRQGSDGQRIWDVFNLPGVQA